MNKKKAFFQKIRTGVMASILGVSLLIQPESALAIQSSGTSSITSSTVSIDSPCLPSIIAFAIASAINLTERIASSFPGIA